MKDLFLAFLAIGKLSHWVVEIFSYFCIFREIYWRKICFESFYSCSHKSWRWKSTFRSRRDVIRSAEIPRRIKHCALSLGGTSLKCYCPFLHLFYGYFASVVRCITSRAHVDCGMFPSLLKSAWSLDEYRGNFFQSAAKFRWNQTATRAFFLDQSIWKNVGRITAPLSRPLV